MTFRGRWWLKKARLYSFLFGNECCSSKFTEQNCPLWTLEWKEQLCKDQKLYVVPVLLYYPSVWPWASFFLCVIEGLKKMPKDFCLFKFPEVKKGFLSCLLLYLQHRAELAQCQWVFIERQQNIIWQNFIDLIFSS